MLRQAAGPADDPLHLVDRVAVQVADRSSAENDPIAPAAHHAGKVGVLVPVERVDDVDPRADELVHHRGDVAVGVQVHPAAARVHDPGQLGVPGQEEVGEEGRRDQHAVGIPEVVADVDHLHAALEVHLRRVQAHAGEPFRQPPHERRLEQQVFQGRDELHEGVVDSREEALDRARRHEAGVPEGPRVAFDVLEPRRVAHVGELEPLEIRRAPHREIVIPDGVRVVVHHPPVAPLEAHDLEGRPPLDHLRLDFSGAAVAEGYRPSLAHADEGGVEVPGQPDRALAALGGSRLAREPVPRRVVGGRAEGVLVPALPWSELVHRALVPEPEVGTGDPLGPSAVHHREEVVPVAHLASPRSPAVPRSLAAFPPVIFSKAVFVIRFSRARSRSSPRCGMRSSGPP